MTATWDDILDNLPEVIETKAGLVRMVGRKPKFDEHEHPRDREGRFIETGSEVRLLGGALGTVVGKGTGDRIQVRRNDTGRVFEIDKGNLTVTKRPDGSAPTDKPEDNPGKLETDPTQALIAGTQAQLDADATRRADAAAAAAAAPPRPAPAAPAAAAPDPEVQADADRVDAELARAEASTGQDPDTTPPAGPQEPWSTTNVIADRQREAAARATIDKLGQVTLTEGGVHLGTVVKLGRGWQATYHNGSQHPDFFANRQEAIGALVQWYDVNPTGQRKRTLNGRWQMERNTTATRGFDVFDPEGNLVRNHRSQTDAESQVRTENNRIDAAKQRADREAREAEAAAREAAKPRDQWLPVHGAGIASWEMLTPEGNRLTIGYYAANTRRVTLAGPDGSTINSQLVSDPGSVHDLDAAAKVTGDRMLAEHRGGGDGAAGDRPVPGGHVIDEPATPTLASNLAVGQVVGELQPGAGRRYFEVTRRWDRATGSYGRRELGVEGATEEDVRVSSMQMTQVMDNGMPDGGGAGRPVVGPGAGGGTPEEQYIAAQLRARRATTMAEAGAAEKEAQQLARRHKLDTVALEDRIQTELYTGMSDEELQRALRDPSTRTRARAEITRRAAGGGDPEPAPAPDPAPVADGLDGLVNRVAGGDPALAARVRAAIDPRSEQAARADAWRALMDDPDRGPFEQALVLATLPRTGRGRAADIDTAGADAELARLADDPTHPLVAMRTGARVRVTGDDGSGGPASYTGIVRGVGSTPSGNMRVSVEWRDSYDLPRNSTLTLPGGSPHVDAAPDPVPDPVPDPDPVPGPGQAIPEAFTDADHLGTFLAGYLGLKPDNAPRLARIFGPKTNPDFRAIGAVERRLDDAGQERFRRLQATLAATRRAKDGQLDGQRAADALRRLEANDPSLPLNSVGQRIAVRQLDENAPQPLFPNADRPLIYREITGTVVEAKDTGTGVYLVIRPDNPNDGPRTMDGDTLPFAGQGFAGDAKLELLGPVDGGPAPDPDPTPGPEPTLPDPLPTVAAKRAGDLAVGDRFLVDGELVTVSVAPRDVDGTLTLSYTDRDGVEWDYETDAGEMVSAVGGGEDARPPLPDETPDDLEPDDATGDPTVSPASLSPGDRFRSRNGVHTVVEVTDSGNPDTVLVTTDYHGTRTTRELGRDAVLTRLDDGDLPAPGRRVDRATALRPALQTYQRRKLVALGLDFDGNDAVAVAAQRIRLRQEITPAQAEALAARLRSIAEQPGTHKPQARSYRRMADLLDVGRLESGSRTAPVRFEPGFKPERGTVRDLTDGDQVAFADLGGQTVTGKITGLRSKLSGRLYEVSVEHGDGTTSTHLLNRGTVTYRLGDLPDPTVVPPPPPERSAPLREHVNADRVNVGDRVLHRGGLGVVEMEVTGVTRVGDTQTQLDLRGPDGATFHELFENASRADGGPTVLRTARGDLSADQPFDTVLPDDKPTDITAKDMKVGDRISYRDNLGREIQGTVLDVETVDHENEDSRMAKGEGRILLIRSDSGDINSDYLHQDKPVTRLIEGDANAAERIARQREERLATRRVTETAARLDNMVDEQVDRFLGNLRMGQGNGRDFLLEVFDRDSQRYLANSTPSGDAIGVLLAARGSYATYPDATDPQVVAIRELVSAQVADAHVRLRASLAEAEPFPGEADHEMVARILDQWENDPPRRDTAAVARSLIGGVQAISDTPAGVAGGRTVVPTLPEGADLKTRMDAYRAALPGGSTANIGNATKTRASWGKLDLDALERGEIPSVVMTTQGQMDLAPDGGPGEHAMAHLDVVMAAGRDMRLAYEKHLADIRSRSTAEEVTPEEEAEAKAASEAAVKAMRDWVSTNQDRIAKRNGYKNYSEMHMASWNAADPAEREKARQARMLYQTLEREDEKYKALTAAYQQVLDQRVKLNQRKSAGVAAGKTMRRQAALAALAEVRPVGGHQLEYVSGTRGKTWGKPLTERSKLVQAMRFAESNYPTDWLKLADSAQNGRKYELKSVSRGYHRLGTKHIALSAGEADPVAGAGTSGRVATHELGHGMENWVPGLLAAERAYLWSRTSEGEVGSRKRLPKTVIYRGETGYKDQFPEHYTGKDYGTPGRMEAYEIFTTGVESVFAGSEYHDESLTEFVLGTMALI